MRILLALQLAMLGVAGAQAIPPTPPTAGTPTGAQTVPSAPPAAAPEPSKAAQRANVTFASGSLSIAADNSSLNQILRDISRLTGMKITGGVTDERVYGSFGPADASTVLAALLSGTGSNMMLIFDARQAPSELVLTPRGGGPTPPNPMVGRADDRDEEDLPPQLRPHIPRPEMRGEPAPQPAPAPQPQPAAATPASVPDTTNQQVSPNGVPTVDEIYQRLRANQQKQQQQAPPTTPP